MRKNKLNKFLPRENEFVAPLLAGRDGGFAIGNGASFGYVEELWGKPTTSCNNPEDSEHKSCNSALIYS